MSTPIPVNEKMIGSNSTFVIAEIGANHCRDIALAYETIDAAKESGADAVKFQSLNIDELYYEPSNEIKHLHSQIDLPEEWHGLLKAYCDKKGIVFFSSPTYFKSVDIMEQLEVPLYKLASAQIGTFPQLIQKVARTKKPVILSTGLVSYSELEKVVNIFREADNNNFIILHCNSIYPTPYEKVHLGLMEVYSKMFGCITGFSDHTEGIAIPLAAVAKGAKVIEKHFVLNKQVSSPDAAISIEPNIFKEMVNGIRAIEKASIMSYRTDIDPAEQGFKNRILYKLVLNTDKRANETIAENDFAFKRSPNGIDCKELGNIISKKYKKDIKAGTLLTHLDIA